MLLRGPNKDEDMKAYLITLIYFLAMLLTCSLKLKGMRSACKTSKQMKI